MAGTTYHAPVVSRTRRRSPGFLTTPFGITLSSARRGTRHATIKASLITHICVFATHRNVSVIKQCGLERDLALFQAGDVTEVGEKGLTLRQVTTIRSCLAVLNTLQRRPESARHSRACYLLKR
jgi:hypothetical protein